MSFGIHLTMLIGPTIPVPVPFTLTQAIQSIEITNTDQGRDGFQITFTAGRGGPTGIFDDPLISNPLLTPFNRVILMVTIGLTPRVLIDGMITHHQFNPSQDPGKSTFVVTGEDISVMMDMEEKIHKNDNMPDLAIVNKIILSYAQYGLMPNVIPPLSMSVPISVDYTPTQQATDLSYVQQLATENSYCFYIEPTDVPGINKAYWGPKINVQNPPQSALSANLGAQTNVTSINFQYNSLKPYFVKGKVDDRTLDKTVPVQTLGSLRIPLTLKPAWLVNQPNVRKKHFSGNGLNTLEAYSKAQSETDNSIDAVSASGEIDSVAYGDVLRARRLVGVRGIGNSYDGIYYVKNVTHKIKIGEYKQSFNLTREGLGSISPVVPT